MSKTQKIEKHKNDMVSAWRQALRTLMQERQNDR